ncbi:autotransporter domain-containing protein [Stappia sp. BW2]|uniref:autotransporter outer membrane beta-barrel domain-containing protein n=1 Tax=Stappia sp. BW2 TaxID=2592622 RepID=UPI0013967B0A|nr:autotransporter domain-containing protein [Stappia sp. BW2]
MLGSSALVGAGLVFGPVPTAQAACENNGVVVDPADPLVNGSNLACDDIVINDTITANDPNVSVTLGDGDNANGEAVLDIDDGDGVTIVGDSSVTVNADGSVTSVDDGVYGADGSNTVILNGGSITAGDDGIYLHDDNNTITLNGGSIEAGDEGIYAYGDGNTVTVNNGTIVADDDPIDIYGDNNTVTINGGTIEAGEDGIESEGKNNAITINGGTISADEDGIYAEGDGNTVTINGGTISAGNDGIYADGDGSTVTINSGTISADEDGIYAEGDGNTVTINGGTISAGNDGIYADGDDSKVTVNGGTLTGVDGIEVTGTGTIVTVKGGSITGKTKDGINLDNGSNTVIVEGGSIKAAGTGIAASDDSNTITVSGGTIEAGDDGINIKDTSGIGGNTVTISGGTITAADNVFEINSIGGTNTFNLSTDATVSGDFLALDGTTANFNLVGTGDSTLDGDIEGFTLLSKEDSGIFRLNGAITQPLPIAINGGTLAINGDASGGEVTVNSGSRLQGVGTVGTADILDGGTLGAGNSIGTFAVAQDLTFDAGSSLEVELEDTGNVDLVTAGNDVTINGGTVKVLTSWTGSGSSAFVPGAEFTLLTAGNAVTGSFDTLLLAQDFAFLDGALITNPKDVVLTIQRNNVAFADLAETKNQKAAAAAAESAGQGNEIFDAVIGISEDQAPTLFNFLTGEVHASTQGILLQEGIGNRNRIMSHLRDSLKTDAQSQGDIATHGNNPGPSGYRLASWGQVYGSFVDLDSDGNAVGAEASTGGLIVGAGTTVGYGVHAGLFGGFSRTDIEADDIASTANVESFLFGAYAGREYGDFRVLGGASYSLSDISTDRTVNAGSLNERLQADYNSHTFQAFAETGYRFENAFAALEPFAGLSHIAVLSDGFTEKGGIAAVTSPSQTQNVTYTSLGLRVEKEFQLESTKGKLHSYASWQHAFGDTTTSLEQAFVSGGNPFTIHGAPIAEDALVVGAGLELQVSNQVSIGFNYGGQFADGNSENTVSGRLNARF